MSLTFRILLILFVSISINSSIILYNASQQQNELNQTYEKIVVDTVSEVLSDSLVRDLLQNNVLEVTNLLKQLNDNNEIIEYIYLTDMNNNIFAHTFTKGFPKRLLESIKVPTEGRGTKLINKFQTDTKVIYEYKNTFIDGVDAAVYIGINKSRFSTILLQNTKKLIISVFITTLLLLVLASYSSKKTVRPLSQVITMLEQTQEAEAFDFSNINSDAKEIKQLIKTLNSAMQTIAYKEKNLSTTLDSIGDAVIVTDGSGKIVRMNPVAEKLMGYTLEDVYLQDMSDVFIIVDATTRERMFDPAQKVITDKKIIHLHNHTTLIAKDGVEYQISDSAAPIFNEADEVVGVIVIFQDGTEQYQLREQSKSTLEQLERIFRGVRTQILILERDGTIVISNDVLDFFKEEGVIGKKVWELRNIIKDKRFYEKIQKLVQQAAHGEDIDIDVQHSGGWLSLHFQAIRNSESDIVQIILEVTDITQRKNSEEKIRYQANYDALTGIANRSLSLIQLEQALKESHRNKTSVAVLFLDLDNFKNINDTLGHDAGDKMLIQVAKRLKKVLRDKDVIGRLGGDEFIVFLNDITDIMDIQAACNNILQSFTQAFNVDEMEVLITLSIGVAVYPTNGVEVSELLINADIAMYDAKKRGKNNYSFFTKEMNSDITRQLTIENKISKALQTEELQVFYQPKIDIKTSKMVGVEALLRWTNEELGFISPEEFIPIAEKSAHIINIGYYVIEEVAQTLQKWHDSIDDDFRVSINLSPIQFRDSSLLANIQKTFQKYEIDTSHIDFELTESAFIDQGLEIEKKLHELKSIGVTISMDDFGTGYASLGYLKDYPFDIIKIDKSFIMNMETASQDKSLVKAIIAMAKSLELKVVAEGVETEEILLSLRDMECDYAQGYYFSKAVPDSEIYEQLKN